MEDADEAYSLDGSGFDQEGAQRGGSRGRQSIQHALYLRRGFKRGFAMYLKKTRCCYRERNSSLTSLQLCRLAKKRCIFFDFV
jgi:hypothetical protein